jgi:sec-independent protein translocase protein TatC
MAGFIEEREKSRPHLSRPGDEDIQSRMHTLETKPFLAHLEDLRWTIVRCLVALAGGVILCAFLARQILQLLYRPLIATGHQPKDLLRNMGVVDPFSIHMEISLFGGVILSLPLLLYFIGQFFLPALTPSEKRFLGPVFGAGAALFVVGVMFCYELVLKITLQFFLSYNDYFGWGTMWTAKALIDFEVQMLVGFGLAFEMPLVILVLNIFGLVTSAQLAAKRRHAAVVIFIAACCIVPSTDLFSLSILTVPLYLLYEACIWIGRIIERRRKRESDSTLA